MKKVITVIIFIVLMAIGIGIIGYPLASNFLMSMNSDSEVQTYLSAASNLDSEEYDKQLALAQEYNDSLKGNYNIGDPFGKEIETDDEYYDLLNIDGTSVMACIEIPALKIKYPIYHGTSDDVLNKGIGHMRNTSLPIGGKGTHTVLTGHTGLSNAKLFTDIDKLEEEDVFYIYVMNQTLAYSIDQIKVVEPSDTSDLKIDDENDYVTLVTCTPYGLNTHRLLVRGTRIPYVESKKEAQPSRVEKSTYNEEYMSAIIIGGLVMTGILFIYVLIKIVLRICRKRKNNE
ncbi:MULTISPECIES: class C sortase [unclassified Ruminococcus]|uniref:class C sortase n=1 Tax=unclassified Ruminococcus TaxID=2608920 RepID=UPI00210DBE25|nr:MULTISPECIES: class C sortase [unclassified Ruminococcus]MCQ4021706.1 class C sortase [Ruminococcus sp. zg-924]MCQ4114151.1 class C sortase [Ruminococcus sp. zg-921]